MFRINIGPTERVFRVLLGTALLAFALRPGVVPWWSWLGIVPLATGLAAHCPLWDALGISTVRGPRVDLPETPTR